MHCTCAVPTFTDVMMITRIMRCVHSYQQRVDLRLKQQLPQLIMYSHSDNTNRPWTGQSRATSLTRPRTGQSRPGTTQAPTTAVTSRHDASFIIALLEGRGIAREVGIAALDRDTGRAVLIQVESFSRRTWTSA